MNRLRTVSQVTTIVVMLLIGCCYAANSSPSVSELLNKYTRALDTTQSFISSWNTSSVVSSNVPSLALKYSHEKVFSRGQHRTDNKGRSYTQTYTWGYLGQQTPKLTEDNPRYYMAIIGDGFTYHHSALVGSAGRRGSAEYMEEKEDGSGYLDRNDTNNFVMGYFQTKSRLDMILKSSKRISADLEPEILNGSLCYVIEASTKYGEFKVWLDSEHDFHPARVKAIIEYGDDIGDPGTPYFLGKGFSREYSLDNVRFEKVDGVWVPMEADRKMHVILGSADKFTDSKTHFIRTKIELNPDHDALNSFADPMKKPEVDPELVNGTKVKFGDGIKRTWLDGKAVADGS